MPVTFSIFAALDPVDILRLEQINLNEITILVWNLCLCLGSHERDLVIVREFAMEITFEEANESTVLPFSTHIKQYV